MPPHRRLAMNTHSNLRTVIIIIITIIIIIITIISVIIIIIKIIIIIIMRNLAVGGLYQSNYFSYLCLQVPAHLL